jgi:Putative DNA-binding domain
VRLAELQTAFLAYVSGAPAGPTILPFVRDHGRVSVRQRLAIHAQAFGVRTRDHLAQAFPHTATLMGKETFARSVADHVARIHAVPAPRPNVFRTWHLYLREASPLPERPDLADLAALELARREVAEAVAAPAIGLAALATVAPDRMARLRLRFVPALDVVRARFDVFDLWEALEAGGAVPPPTGLPTDLLVWRREGLVFHSALRPPEDAALHAARGGAALSVVCAAFADAPTPDQTAHDVLAGWFEDEMVAAVEFPEAA